MRAVCNECGVPLIISKTHTWRDGCIVDDASGNANFCVYEADFHNNLLARAGDELGISLDSIVLNAGRNASAKVVRDGLSSHPLIAKVIFKAPFYRLSQPVLTYFGRSIGLGKIEVLYHRKGKRGALRFTDPYHMAHCSGALLGCMDVMYGYPVNYAVSEEGEGVLLCELKPGKEDYASGEEAFRRLATIDLVPTKAKNGSLPACGRCGVPRDVGEPLRVRPLRRDHNRAGERRAGGPAGALLAQLHPEGAGERAGVRRQRPLHRDGGGGLQEQAGVDLAGRGPAGHEGAYATTWPCAAWACSRRWKRTAARPPLPWRTPL